MNDKLKTKEGQENLRNMQASTGSKPAEEQKAKEMSRSQEMANIRLVEKQ